MLGFKVDDSGREQYNKGIDQTKQKQQSLTASFLKANLIMSTVNRGIGAAFGFIRHEVIGVTAETERFRVVIGNMIGDQEKANKVIHELDYSPVSDFYGTAAAIGGLRSFVTMGMDIEKARDQMTLLGDVAQGNGEAFASLSSTMAQVYSRGKADTMRLKQFMSQGFDVTGVLGLTEAQQKAGVTYAQVEEALRRVTVAGGPYNNMLQKQMNTLGGVLKQLKSLKAATAEAIGLGINDELKGLLKYILEIGRAGQENFVGVFVKAIKEVIHWIWQIIIMWKVLNYRLADMGDALAPVKQFFFDLKDAAGDVLTGIMILAVELGKLIVAAFKPIQAFASPIIKELGAIAKDVFTAIADFIRPLVPMVSRSAGFFGVLGQTIAGLLRPMLKVALAIKGITLALGAYKAAMGIAKTASFIFSGDLAKIAAGLTKLTGSGKFARGLADTFGLLTGKLSVMRKASEGNRVAMMMLDAQMLKNKVTTIAHTAATKVAAIATKAWAVIQGAFNAVMAANPVGLIVIAIIAGIALIGFAIFQLVKHWDKVKAAFKANSDKIMSILTVLLGPFVVIISVIKEIISNWDNVVKAFTDGGIIEGLKILGGTILSGVLAPVQGLLELLSKIPGVGKLFEPAVKGIEKLRNNLKGIEDVDITLELTTNGVDKNIKGIWNSITGFFKEKTKELLADFKEKYPVLYETAAAVFGKIKNVVTAVFGWIKKYFSAVWQSLKASLGALINFFKNVFLAVWNVVKTIGLGIWGIIKAVFDSIKNVVMSVLGVFKTVFTSVWNVIKTIFSTVLTTVLSIFDGLISIWKGGGNIFVKIWQSIQLIFSKVWQGIFTIIKAAWAAIVNIWESIVNVFSVILEGIRNVFLAVWGAIENIVLSVVDGIKNIWISFSAFMVSLWNGIKAVALIIWEGIKAVFFAVIDAIKFAWQDAINFIVGLWEDIKEAVSYIWNGITDVFFGVIDGIKSAWQGFSNFLSKLWNGIIGFFKKWGELILQILAVVIFGIPGLVAVAVRQIIKHWDVIGPKVKAVWGKIKTFFIALCRQIADIFLTLVNKIKQAFQWVVDRAIAIWDTLKSWFGILVEAIKGIWLSITGWFAGLWEGIVNTAMAIWDTLKSWFSGLVEGIKDIWNGIIGFFSGLWEAMKQGPTEAIEYIKNAFFGLFNSVQERFLGFISKIKEGWESVKGFFGDIADGAVNFFTGGNDGAGGSQVQPAYAGSASQAAMAGTVGQTSSYAYTTTGGSSTVNAQTSINVNVPPGTPQEQREAIARQVDAQFNARLADSINSSRANIPSPEVRRH